jgi:SAM-dependent methyltransferase
MGRSKGRVRSFLAVIGAIALLLAAIPLTFYLMVYALARNRNQIPPWAQSMIDRYYYPTYLSDEHIARVPNMVAEWGAQAHILNVGGGMQSYAPNVVNIDVMRTETTNLLADAHTLPFKDASFDAVVAIAVYEHLARPWEVTEEIERVLKPGGHLYVEAPFLAPYHADPDDYYRYTIPGLRSMFRNFVEQETGVCNGPGSMLTWTLREISATVADVKGNFDTSHTRVADGRYMRAKEAGKLLFGAVKYLDHLLLDKEHSFVTAEGVFYRGTKRRLNEQSRNLP